MEKSQCYNTNENALLSDFGFLDLRSLDVSSSLFDVSYFFLKSFLETISIPLSKKRAVLFWYDVFEPPIPLTHGVLATVFLAVVVITLQWSTEIFFDVCLLCFMLVVWGGTIFYTWCREKYHKVPREFTTQNIKSDVLPSYSPCCFQVNNPLNNEYFPNISPSPVSSFSLSSPITTSSPIPCISPHQYPIRTIYIKPPCAPCHFSSVFNCSIIDHQTPETTVCNSETSTNANRHTEEHACPECSLNLVSSPNPISSTVEENASYSKSFCGNFLKGCAIDRKEQQNLSHFTGLEFTGQVALQPNEDFSRKCIQENEVLNVQNLGVSECFIQTKYLAVNPQVTGPNRRLEDSPLLFLVEPESPQPNVYKHETLNPQVPTSPSVEAQSDCCVLNSAVGFDSIIQELIDPYIKNIEYILKKYVERDIALPFYKYESSTAEDIVDEAIEQLIQLSLAPESSGSIHLNESSVPTKCADALCYFVKGVSGIISHHLRLSFWPQSIQQFSLSSGQSALTLCRLSQAWIDSYIQHVTPSSCSLLTDYIQIFWKHLDNLRIILGCVKTYQLNGLFGQIMIHCYLNLALYQDALDLFCDLLKRLKPTDLGYLTETLNHISVTPLANKIKDALIDKVFYHLENMKSEKTRVIQIEGGDFPYGDWVPSDFILELFNVLPHDYVTQILHELLNKETIQVVLTFFLQLCERLPYKATQLNVALFRAYTSIKTLDFQQVTELLKHTNFKCIPSQLVTDRLNWLLSNAVVSDDTRLVWLLVDQLQYYHLEISLDTVALLIKALKPSSYLHNRTRILNLIDYSKLSTDTQYFPILANVFVRLKETHRLKYILSLFNENQENLDSYTIGTFIKACGRCGEIGRGWTFWCRLIKTQKAKLNSYVYGCMLDMFVSNNHVEIAILLLQNASYFGVKPNTVQYCIVIKGCAQQKKLVESLKLYFDMQKKNIPCNAVTYNALINACIASREIETAKWVMYDMVSKSPFQPDVITFSTLIKGFCEQGSLNGALYMLEVMEAHHVQPDVVTYNTLLEACCRGGNRFMVEHIFQHMLQHGVSPTCFTLTILIKYCGKSKQLENALHLATHLPRLYHFENDAYVYTALIAACITCDNLPRGLMFFIDLNKSPYKKQISVRTFGTVCLGSLKAGYVLAAYAFVYEAACRRLNLDPVVLTQVATNLEQTILHNKQNTTPFDDSVPTPLLSQSILWLQNRTQYTRPQPLSLSQLQYIFNHLHISSSALKHLFTETLAQKISAVTVQN